MNSTIEKNAVLILEESVCIERVKSLINHPDVIVKDIKLLKSYWKITIKDWKNLWFHIQKKVVVLDEDMLKNLYLYDTHLDIDIKNCGLNIFSQYCEKNNIQSNVLNTFNEKREENLNEIINACNVSRDTAKDLILRITFLGSIEEFIMVNHKEQSLNLYMN